MISSLALLPVISSAFAGNELDTIRVTMSGYGPRDEILVRRPTLIWQVWPEPGNLVSGASVTVNGKKAKATYNKAARSLEFSPAEPFEAGQHEITAQVVVNGWAKFDKKWTIRVLANAQEELKGPSDGALQAIEALNEVRKSVGLPPGKIDNRLCAAAADHAAYIFLNNDAGHSQQPGRQGFTGVEPADRMSRMGFAKGAWEILAPSVTDPETGIKRLFDAPYHRISMLQPSSIEVGAGYFKGNVVVDGEISYDTQTVVSPADQQSNVQPFWKDTEYPNPFRVHAISGGLVGYPIVFVRFGASKITVSEFSLRDEQGSDVQLLKNLPAIDDQLTNAAFIMPTQPLAEGKTYKVIVRAKDDKGVDISKTWSFTTASDASFLARMLSMQPSARETYPALPAKPRRLR